MILCDNNDTKAELATENMPSILSFLFKHCAKQNALTNFINHFFQLTYLANSFDVQCSKVDAVDCVSKFVCLQISTIS